MHKLSWTEHRKDIEDTKTTQVRESLHVAHVMATETWRQKYDVESAISTSDYYSKEDSLLLKIEEGVRTEVVVLVEV